MTLTTGQTDTSSSAMALTTPWASASSLLPPLGNLDAYISAVNRLP
ncbi:MAG: RNA polymerase sigma-32 factor, partial [Litorivivens sp.]